MVAFLFLSLSVSHGQGFSNLWDKIEKPLNNLTQLESFSVCLDVLPDILSETLDCYLIHFNCVEEKNLALPPNNPRRKLK